ncbi:hypothetical protein [Homoserinibacter sp. GY 40078]|uniref:hypothetical protein n=1 Tax=Homoserinibacter sp. GY 40078 TaxID=2603275 RepID=UPI002104AAC9|nr:hypothetical protein [Homoserinibacter sp. GY 40078]
MPAPRTPAVAMDRPAVQSAPRVEPVAQPQFVAQQQPVQAQPAVQQPVVQQQPVQAQPAVQAHPVQPQASAAPAPLTRREARHANTGPVAAQPQPELEPQRPAQVDPPVLTNPPRVAPPGTPQVSAPTGAAPAPSVYASAPAPAAPARAIEASPTTSVPGLTPAPTVLRLPNQFSASDASTQDANAAYLASLGITAPRPHTDRSAEVASPTTGPQPVPLTTDGGPHAPAPGRAMPFPGSSGQQNGGQQTGTPGYYLPGPQSR